ncbi:hypothetical protein C8R47DRAFT_1267828 [Mycena vitilis]|nr:hypothetical protein C8R47DRAFT_1267828 [Mycena vitilis]
MSDTAPTTLPQSALPTFHAAAHSPRCALESPYLAGTAGVTDGESVERFWALAAINLDHCYKKTVVCDERRIPTPDGERNGGGERRGRGTGGAGGGGGYTHRRGRVTAPKTAQFASRRPQASPPRVASGTGAGNGGGAATPGIPTPGGERNGGGERRGRGTGGAGGGGGYTHRRGRVTAPKTVQFASRRPQASPPRMASGTGAGNGGGASSKRAGATRGGLTPIMVQKQGKCKCNAGRLRGIGGNRRRYDEREDQKESICEEQGPVGAQ